MSQFKIIVPLDVNGDYQLGGNDTDISFDRGVSRASTIRVLTAKFGDGYEQRLLDGINTIEETISANFKNREESEIYAIRDFLNAQAPNSFTCYLNNDSFSVVCETYSITHNYGTIFSLSAEFRRVYQL